MPDLDQHQIFAVPDLIDDVPARRPWWLPASEPDADWTFPRSGDFPTLPDPALCAPEEKP
jgi:hypothetical protein